MEVWDLYDENLNKTDKIILSNNEIPDGFYHFSPEIWIINNRKEVLLIKNSIDYSKRYPDMWCCIGGNLKSNESVEESIIRIVNEKIGLKLSDVAKKIINAPVKRDPHRYAYITSIVFENINLNDIKLNDNNSSEAKFVNKQELSKMCKNGEIAYYLIERINNEVIEYMN